MTTPTSRRSPDYALYRRIRQMLNQGFTQSAIAERLGHYQSRVSQILNDPRNLTQEYEEREIQDTLVQRVRSCNNCESKYTFPDEDGGYKCPMCGRVQF